MDVLRRPRFRPTGIDLVLTFINMKSCYVQLTGGKNTDRLVR